MADWNNVARRLSELKYSKDPKVNLDNMDKLFNSLQAGNSEMQGLFEITYLYLQSVGAGSATHMELQNRMSAIPTSVVQDQIDRGAVIRAVTLAMIAALYENILKNGQLEKLKLASEQLLKFLGVERARHRKMHADEEDDYWDDIKQAAQKLAVAKPDSSQLDFAKGKIIDACDKLEEILPKDDNILKEAVSKIKGSILKDIENNTPKVQPKKMKKS